MKLPILLFDSECALCVRFTQALKLIDSDSQVSIVSIYEDDIYNIYPKLKKEDCEATIHLIAEGGVILQGSQVIEYLVSILPAVSKFSWLVESDSSKKALQAFYSKVNDVRKIIKKKGCTGCGRTRSKDL